jgi:phosphatidylethanolamine-binding protein (PEBP) family uncharacterized protein
MSRIIAASIVSLEVASGFSRTNIEVTCSTLKPNQPTPRDHTADGRNISPALTWTNVPAGTYERTR